MTVTQTVPQKTEPAHPTCNHEERVAKECGGPNGEGAPGAETERRADQQARELEELRRKQQSLKERQEEQTHEQRSHELP